MINANPLCKSRETMPMWHGEVSNCIPLVGEKRKKKSHKFHILLSPILKIPNSSELL